MKYACTSAVLVGIALASPVVVDDCAKLCNEAHKACITQPGANHASCASQYTECLGYNPFDKDHFEQPTACHKDSGSQLDVKEVVIVEEQCECARACTQEWTACGNAPGAHKPTCATKYTACVGYGPFGPDGTHILPKTCNHDGDHGHGGADPGHPGGIIHIPEEDDDSHGHCPGGPGSPCHGAHGHPGHGHQGHDHPGHDHQGLPGGHCPGGPGSPCHVESDHDHDWYPVEPDHDHDDDKVWYTVEPEHPAHHGHPEHPAHHGYPDHPAHQGHPEHPAHQGHPEHPAHSWNPERPDHARFTEHPGHAVAPAPAPAPAPVCHGGSGPHCHVGPGYPDHAGAPSGPGAPGHGGAPSGDKDEECTKICTEKYNACRGKDGVHGKRSTCDSEYTSCLGASPFGPDGSLNAPKSCSHNGQSPSQSPEGSYPGHKGSAGGNPPEVLVAGGEHARPIMALLALGLLAVL